MIERPRRVHEFSYPSQAEYEQDLDRCCECFRHCAPEEYKNFDAEMLDGLMRNCRSSSHIRGRGGCYYVLYRWPFNGGDPHTVLGLYQTRNRGGFPKKRHWCISVGFDPDRTNADDVYNKRVKPACRAFQFEFEGDLYFASDNEDGENEGTDNPLDDVFDLADSDSELSVKSFKGERPYAAWMNANLPAGKIYFARVEDTAPSRPDFP